MPPVVGIALAAVEIVAAGAAALGAAAASAGLLAAGGGLTALGTGVLTVGLGIAAWGAEKLLAPSRSGGPSIPNMGGSAPNVTFEAQPQSIAWRFWHYGRLREGGFFIYRKVAAGNYLCYNRIISCRPIDGIESHFIDDELTPLSSGPARGYSFSAAVQWPVGGIKYGSFSTSSTVYIPGYGLINTTSSSGNIPFGFLEFRNATEAGHTLELFTKLGVTEWTAQHLAKGLAVVASAWAVIDSGQRLTRYPKGLPQHSEALRGAPVYDPRDATQDFLLAGVYSEFNPTWRFSENPALIIADYLTYPGGYGLTYDDIDWPSFIAAADRCDALVAGFSGPRKFATAAVKATADMEPRQFLSKLEAACDGQLYETPEGKIGLWIAEYIEPDLTLTDADLAGAVSWRHTAGIMAEQNVVTAAYIEPRARWVRSDAPPVRDEASIAAYGELPSPLDLEAVTDFSQAYDIAARVLRRKNTPLVMNFQAGPRGLLLDGLRTVRLVSDYVDGGIDAVFRIVKLDISGDLSSASVELHLITPDMFVVSVPPYDPINPSAGGAGYVYQPQTPLAPTLAAETVTGGQEIAAAVAAPTNPPDSAAVAWFRSREVSISTGDALSDWTNWTARTDVFAMASPRLSGPAATRRFEVECWFTSNSASTSNFSPSSFIDLVFVGGDSLSFNYRENSFYLPALVGGL